MGQRGSAGALQAERARQDIDQTRLLHEALAGTEG